jgi:hypothetical protein
MLSDGASVEPPERRQLMQEHESVAPPPGSYPIALGVTTGRELSRWWGVPLLGSAVRFFLCIPHFVVLQILGIALFVWLAIGWIWILAFGRVPGLVVRIATESMQRSARVLGYALFLMPGEYPPLEPGPSTPINVQVAPETLEINRWWGVPVAGILVRVLILLPQMIVASILWTVVTLLILVVWIPILATGRYPGWAASFSGLTLRYTVRMTGYLLFLPVPYPPLMAD